MANRQQKRQPPRNTTNIVVRNGSSSNQAGPPRAQQTRRRRNRKKPQLNIRVLANQNKAVRRNPRRQGVGSRIVFQKISTTLGTVGSNGSDQIECEMTCILNPATMKEATGSNNFGPLGIYASTYALYKMTRCEMRLKPLVGDSAVSGTVCRASWNPTATPSQTSWSSLGARKHIDVTPGKVGKFVLTAKDLKGPKDGWYKTNTQGDPMMALAGALEIHTIGKTMSTYRNEHFTGGLFLVEVLTEWQFKDYQQQPGLVNLVKGEDTQNAKIETGDGNKLQLVLPAQSRMARAATTTASEIIWVVSDTVIQLGTALIPPPFSWLIRGGWWLVKRAAGAPVRTGEMRFDIYASISDARSNTPCIVQQSITQPVQVGGLHFQQITPGNTGIGTDIPMARAIDLQPGGAPTQCIITSAARLKLGTSTDNTDNTLVPSYSAWYSNLTNQNFNTGLGFTVSGRNVATYNMYKVTVLANGVAANPSQFENQIPVKLYHATGSVDIGFAVAARYDLVNSTPVLRVSSLLVYATRTQAYNFQKNWRITTVNYPVAHAGNPYSAMVNVPTATANKSVRLRLEAGNWYLAQFVTLGVINAEYKVGDITIASNSAENIHQGPTYFTPTANDVVTGLLPPTIAGLTLTVFTASGVREVRSTRSQELDPGFGCDDVCEDPYYSQEEDEDEDEFPEPPTNLDLDPEGDDEDEALELGPDDHYSDPPMSRLVVREEARAIYEQLRAAHSERAARLAANQLFPSDEYDDFITSYHDALADGLSPREARALALGL
nr:capsid protein [Porcine astrovirus 2]